MRRAFAALLAAMFLLPACALAGGEAPAPTPVATYAPDREVRQENADVLPSGPLETVPPESETYPTVAVAAPAQGEETVPMYASPSERDEVLMAYYAGTRVTVLREAMPGFVMAQVGTKEAGVMGYMRKSDLRFDAAAQREIVPRYMMIEMNREAAVYAWCDGQSGELGMLAEGDLIFVIGRNDDRWMQIARPLNSMVEVVDTGNWLAADEAVAEQGFVQMITGLGRGYECTIGQWEVDPIPGEITREQAVKLAVEVARLLYMPDGVREEDAEATWMHGAPGSGYMDVSVTVIIRQDERQGVEVNMGADGTLRNAQYYVDDILRDMTNF